MKKFVSTLVMFLMLWTVVDKQFDSYVPISTIFVIENEKGRRVIVIKDSYSAIIVGDKVKFTPEKRGWGNMLIKNSKIERIR